MKELINKNYKWYLEIANNMYNGKDNPYDIVNECILEILEYPEERQNKILEYLDFYIIKMIKYSTRSVTSRYQQKYNKIKIKEEYAELYSKRDNLYYPTRNNDSRFIADDYIDISERIKIEDKELEINDKIMKILKYKCDRFGRTLFLQKLNDNCSIRSISRKTGINNKTLSLKYNEVILTIKQNLYL